MLCFDFGLTHWPIFFPPFNWLQLEPTAHSFIVRRVVVGRGEKNFWSPPLVALSLSLSLSLALASLCVKREIKQDIHKANTPNRLYAFIPKLPLSRTSHSYFSLSFEKLLYSRVFMWWFGGAVCVLESQVKRE